MARARPGTLVVRPALGLAMLFGGAALVVASAAIRSTPFGVVGSTPTPALVTVVDLAPAVLLFVAAAAVVAVGAPLGIGWIAAAIAISWTVQDWIGWRTGPPLVHAVSILAATVLVPLLVHLACAHPTGRIVSHAQRWAVVWSYGMSLALGLGAVVFYDPFFDLLCTGNCVDNPLLLRTEPGLARGFIAVNRWWWLLAGTALAVWCAYRLRVAGRIARRMLLPVLAPLSLAGLAEAGRGVTLSGFTDGLSSTASLIVLCSRAVALGLLGVGVATFAYYGLRRERAMAELTDSLERGIGGTLQRLLADSLGDDEVRVVYVLPDGRAVDDQGRAGGVIPAPGRAATTVTHGGDVVALIEHDKTVTAWREFGAATRLAIDNERLRVGILAHLAELQASRQRIVNLADTARRTIERDLHDGAQQQLLAVTFQLRLAAAKARQRGELPLTEEIEALQGEALNALEELRDLAHGIYPAILFEAGLMPALRSLARRTNVPLEVSGTFDRRLRPDIEATAYRLVDRWTYDTAQRLAPDAAVHVTVLDNTDRLVIELCATGIAAAHPSPVGLDVVDQIAAVGGTLAVEAGVVRAELQCVS